MENNKKEDVLKRRCAIYTRKSTREGLDQEFSSIDAQREAGENFILSQKGDGWFALSERYDDGGFTGSNMDRPALKRMLQDVDDGKIDCIVVYKVDRLSRSIMDFLSMIQELDKKKVAFVSVTQHFDTRTSLGRLVLNILLSFAQFEREMISERTRDKIAATRRKGKYTGGRPVLGYDVLREKTCLIINRREAEQVQEIYSLYLQEKGLLATMRALEARGYRNKQWVTRSGNTVGGNPFSKNTLHRLLTNVLYIGQMTYKDEIHKGEHPAIVDQEVFQRVQLLLKRNGHEGTGKREKSTALLKGLLHCVPCQSTMTPNFTSKKNKRYRYYTCLKATKEGWDSCPSPSIPAGEIERFVIDQIHHICQDSVLISAMVEELQAETKDLLEKAKKEERQLRLDLNVQYRKLNEMVDAGVTDAESMQNRTILQEQIDIIERRITNIREEKRSVEQGDISEARVVEICKSFDSLWGALTAFERIELIHLIVERVDFDGENNLVSVKFFSTGIKALSDYVSNSQEE